MKVLITQGKKYMTAKEKRLLTIAVVMFVGYMLPFHILPIAQNVYGDYWQSIDRLNQNIERLGGLRKRVEYWDSENKRAKQEQQKITAGLLPGNTRELVGAKMQELVRRLAKNAGMAIKSLDPPDTEFNTGEWLLVIQSARFEASSKTLMQFLQAINNDKFNLVIASLDVRNNRNRLSGTIKVTGFSRVIEMEEENL